LAGRSIVQDPAISVPEVDTQAKLSTSTDAGKEALIHLILVGVEERQGTGERRGRIGSKVDDLLGELLSQDTVVHIAGREALGMALKGVGLLDLTTSGKADVFYAECIERVIRVGTDLTPLLRDEIDV